MAEGQLFFLGSARPFFSQVRREGPDPEKPQRVLFFRRSHCWGGFGPGLGFFRVGFWLGLGLVSAGLGWAGVGSGLVSDGVDVWWF